MGRVFFDTRKNVHALNAAYTVLQSDSGKYFMVSNSSGAGYEITLPVDIIFAFKYLLSTSVSSVIINPATFLGPSFITFMTI